MLHDKSSQNRKLKLRQLVKNVKKKYLAFKLGRSEQDESINRIVSPITTRLDKMTEQIKQEPMLTIKSKLPYTQETMQFQKSPRYSSLTTTTTTTKKELDSGAATSPLVQQFKTSDNDDDGDDDDVFETAQEQQDVEDTRKIVKEMRKSGILKQFLDAYPKNVRSFIQQSLSREPHIDLTYGPKYDYITSTWKLGNTPLTFDVNNGDVILDEKINFPGSNGLLQLLFGKDPIGYEREDEDSYGKILKFTNVHRRDFDPSKPMKSNSGRKYKTIIKKLGKGMMMQYNDKPIEYRYWDSVTELVDRLCLLHASKQAGNTSNDNEIEAIVEELREAGIIY